VCCLTVVKTANGSRAVGAAVRRKLPRKDMDDRVCWEIELFDFAGERGMREVLSTNMMVTCIDRVLFLCR
jgi:hypothetical protein